jgi:hypothetical protein
MTSHWNRRGVRPALSPMLLKPICDVVGSTKDGRWPRRHRLSQSQRAVKRSGTPTQAAPCAALCPLQVYRVLALFWALPTEAVDDGDRRTAGRVEGSECHQIRIASPALGL